MELFHSIDVDKQLKIKGNRGYGVSIAVVKGDGDVETYCAGSGRFGQDFPVNPDMLFQAGSVSKPMFALTLLRYVDRGMIDLDADLSGVLSDFVNFPLTFPALLSHTAGFNVHGFVGYRAAHKPLTLEDVLSGRGNSPKVKRTKPYGAQYSYSGGGITLAELAFTRLTGTTLRQGSGRHRQNWQRLASPCQEASVKEACFARKRHSVWSRRCWTAWDCVFSAMRRILTLPVTADGIADF